MNYKDLPVYIRREDDDIASAYDPVILYDPSGDYNGLVINNISEVSGSSIQYLDSEFARLTGNASNWGELFAPKIKVINSDVQVYLPKFKALKFYNVADNQPSTSGDLGKTFYAFSYDTVNNIINYVDPNISTENKTWAIRWFRSTDSYVYSSYTDTGMGTVVSNILSAGSNDFYSQWKIHGTSTNAGVYCSGTPLVGLDVLNAINSPSGSGFYYSRISDTGNSTVLVNNATYDSHPASGILYASSFDDGYGFVRSFSKVNLGKNYPYIPVSNISVNYQAQNNGNRLIGQTIDQANQFKHGGALQAKVTFNSYVNTNCANAFNTVLDAIGNSRYTLKFANNLFSGCSLNSYNITVDPFKPVMLSADFTVYNPPKENLNKEQYSKVITNVQSTNELLYSESLNSNVWGGTLITRVENQSDPLGGNEAVKITSNSGDVITYDYSTRDYSLHSFAVITAQTYLTELSSPVDKSILVNFAGGKTFSFYGVNYDGVYISNNGYITFGSSYISPECPNALGFPASVNIPIFAGYWTDFTMAQGSIGYTQYDDRFVISYNGCSTTSGRLVYFQIALYFNSPNIGRIRVFYKTDTPNSGVFSKDPIIGLQNLGASGGSVVLHENKKLNTINLSTENRIDFTLATTITPTIGSIIYNSAISPTAARTFSIYLKRGAGVGNILYTKDGGSTWTSITGVTTSWKRFSFPLASAQHRVGISIPTNGDELYVYGAQLEQLSFATDYIPTSSSSATRLEEYFTPNQYFYPSVKINDDFVDKIINGNNCSISDTTNIVSSTQTSIKYSVNCNRTPIYNIGSINSKNPFLDSIEKQMDIISTDLPYFINFSGTKLSSDLSLILKDSDNAISSIIKMSSGSYVSSQQMSIQEGDTLQTQVSIKEIIV